MRTYANFLLFDGVLDNLPSVSVPMVLAATKLLNPHVTIVSPDCQTLIGNPVPADFAAIGLTELATSSVITSSRVNYLLSIGVTIIRTRSTSTCSSKNGLCIKCYSTAAGAGNILDGAWTLDGSHTLNGGALSGSSPITTGTILVVPNRYISHYQLITGDGFNTTFPSSVDSSFYNSTDLPSSTGFISNNMITFLVAPTAGEIIPIHYYSPSSTPLLNYLAKSYSGSILGVSPLPTYKLIVKPSIYQGMFTSNEVSLLRAELDKYASNIPVTTLNYCDTIPDTLEKVLLIIFLYSIYANVI